MKLISLAAGFAALLFTALPGQASVVGDLGINPTSGQGHFSNEVGGATFEDQWTFQLTGFDQFFTIASITNVFPQASDFISDFSASVFLIMGALGGADDVEVIGPVDPSSCGPSCQFMAGSAILAAGDYYAQFSGTGGGTSGYGGDLATRGINVVPIPAALPMFGAALGGMLWLRRNRKPTKNLAV